MQTWEYFTTTLGTNDPNIEVPISDDIPYVEHPRYSPYKLMPQLNYFGNRGWELISIEPVQVGKNGDVRYADAASGVWTYTYLVAFKRAIPGPTS